MGKTWSRTGWQLAHVAVAALALANSGCLVAALGGVAAAGGAAGYVYYKGGLAREFNASLDDSWAAAKTALQELGLPAATEKREKDGGSLETKTADGQAIRIAFEVLPVRVPADGPRTDISVRAGLFGDRELSERILAQIAAHVAPAPAVAGGTPAAPLVPVPQQTAPPPLGHPQPLP